MNNLSVLVLDDEAGIRSEIKEYLSSEGYDVSTAPTPTVALDHLIDNEVDIALVDIRLPEMNGLEVLRRIKKHSPHTEVIMITGHGDMDLVIEAMRIGATDFFNKPFRLSEINQTILNTRNYLALNRKLRKNGKDKGKGTKDPLIPETEKQIIGKSEIIRDVIDMMMKVARTSDTHVLITGESGTGKELIARGIHYLSSRINNPYFPVNCSAVPHELFESEFFGHTKGAFTGADSDKQGWFEAANTGTLFLDEIGDMKPEMQSKMLRVIEEKEISRIGSKRKIRLDLRIVSATNQDLEELVANKAFRKDLYYRLNAFKIHVPALRERKEDIPILISHFIEHYEKKLNKKISKVNKRLLDQLSSYDYPGNVRELKNMIERAMVLCEGEELTIDHFPSIKYNIKEGLDSINVGDDNFNLNQLETRAILKALTQTGNNKSKAALLLNISRQSLDRRILKLGIVVK